MIWQDGVITVGSLILCLTMIPLIRAPEPPPWSASFPIAIVLTVFAVAYCSLGLYLATSIEIIQALAWHYLAAKKAFEWA